MYFLDFSHQSLCLFMDTIPQNSTTCLLLKKMRSHYTHTCAPIYLFLYICIDPTWSHSYHSNHTQLFFLFTFLFLLLRHHHWLWSLEILISLSLPRIKAIHFTLQTNIMENKDTKSVMKKENATLLPPKRGQIKAKIFEELVESVVSITTGGTGKKSEQESSKSNHSSSKESKVWEQARGHCIEAKYTLALLI